MIYRISQFPDLGTDRNDKLRVIENALRSSGESKNVIWMPIDLIDHFIHSNPFGEYCGRVLRDLRVFARRERYAYREFAISIEISFADKFLLNVKDGSIVELGYGHLLDSRLWQKTPILVEDLSDAYIYEVGAKASLVKMRLAHEYDIALEHVNGGGGGSFNNFQRLKDERKVFCAVIDSDKKHPHGNVGSTARRFQQYAGSFDNGYYVKITEPGFIE